MGLGPDGRRDLDVLIRGVHAGRNVTIAIECKDWKKRVGIEVIDALESKRRDIPADIAFICSNSGFTKDARRKAGRVGIGLVTVLQHGDRRIRSVIEFDLYVAHIDVQNKRKYTVHHVEPTQMPEDWDFNVVTIEGRLFWKVGIPIAASLGSAG